MIHANRAIAMRGRPDGQVVDALAALQVILGASIATPAILQRSGGGDQPGASA